MKRPVGPGRLRRRMIRVNVGGRWWGAWYDPHVGLGTWSHYPLCVERECEVCHDSMGRGKPMKMPEVRVLEESQALARVEAPRLLKATPTVAELLVQPAWVDGPAKGERAVFCFVSSTLVKLLVKIECPPLKLMVAGRTWDEAWGALEATLKGSDIPWEQDTPRQAPPKKRSK